MDSEVLMLNVLGDIRGERYRQDLKWGRPYQNPHKRLTILTEEVGEVAKATLDLEHDDSRSYEERLADLRNELVQVAAVAVASIETLDRGEWNWDDTKSVK